MLLPMLTVALCRGYSQARTAAVVSDCDAHDGSRYHYIIIYFLVQCINDEVTTHSESLE
jgi:hypothetical protein